MGFLKKVKKGFKKGGKKLAKGHKDFISKEPIIKGSAKSLARGHAKAFGMDSKDDEGESSSERVARLKKSLRKRGSTKGVGKKTPRASRADRFKRRQTRKTEKYRKTVAEHGGDVQAARKAHAAKKSGDKENRSSSEKIAALKRMKAKYGKTRR